MPENNNKISWFKGSPGVELAAWLSGGLMAYAFVPAAASAVVATYIGTSGVLSTVGGTLTSVQTYNALMSPQAIAAVTTGVSRFVVVSVNGVKKLMEVAIKSNDTPASSEDFVVVKNIGRSHDDMDLVHVAQQKQVQRSNSC